MGDWRNEDEVDEPDEGNAAFGVEPLRDMP